MYNILNEMCAVECSIRISSIELFLNKNKGEWQSYYLLYKIEKKNLFFQIGIN